MMKPIKELLIVLLAIAVVFVFGAPALAAFGSQGGATGAGGIQVYPNAPGTKYEGPLTIYYVPAGTNTFDMYFFLRLRKGSTLHAFSGTALGVPGAVEDQQQAITDFFNNNVKPILYPESNPPALLKSIDQIADDATSGCCGDMVYTIMDVVIAIQD